MSNLEFISKHYGLNNQLNQLQEECGELVQAVSKYRRTGSTLKLIEEMADVLLMIEQIEYLLDCYPEIENIKIHKIIRQIERINEEDDMPEVKFSDRI